MNGINIKPALQIEAVVQVKEYVVCAHPDSSSPNWRHYRVRAIRFDEGYWGVFGPGGIEGQERLDSAGCWSSPPDDDDERQLWREARRFDEHTALELARAAAPLMECMGKSIAEMVAWEAERVAAEAPEVES